MEPGSYRSMMGNQAVAYGLIAASQKSGLPLFLGSYPITPASDILHELSKYKNFGIRTFQAEDEIAAITSAIGAAYGGRSDGDRKSTRLNSSHQIISYAPFCLNKKTS